jgi:hypothetical protein
MAQVEGSGTDATRGPLIVKMDKGPVASMRGEF